MLTINIICVGKIKETYLKDAINEYSKRLSKYCSLNIIELQDEKLPEKINGTLINEIKNKECKKILEHIRKVASPHVTNASHLDKSRKLNLVASKKSNDFSYAIKKDSYTICLDLKGKQYSSEEFSKKIDDIALNFNSTINFIIGGTLGLTDELLSISNEKICFSKMTFPHQLIRVFLLEQLFRAFKISKGETYHW